MCKGKDKGRDGDILPFSWQRKEEEAWQGRWH